MNWLWVAIGGAIGSCMRYGLALAGNAVAGGMWFPWGTFTANVLGSFGLALVFGLGVGRAGGPALPAVLHGVDLPLFLGVGVMGGFTTYSTFNLESLRLIEQGAWGRAALVIVATVVTCLLSALLGLACARLVR